MRSTDRRMIEIKRSITRRELKLTIANSCHQALLTAHYSVKMDKNANEASVDQIAQLAVQHAIALIRALEDSDES